MRQKFTLIVLFVFSLSCRAQNENSLLWEISGNNLSSKSYIFGTMHMMKKQDFFISEVTKDKLLQCHSFVTEVNMNISLLQQVEIMKKMYLPETKTLRDYISPEEYKSFSEYVTDSLGIKKSKLEKYIRLKPFFLSAVISKQVEGKVKAYEKELYKIAKNKGIPSDGLESFDFQFSLVDATPIDIQAQSLVAEVQDYKKTRQLFDSMVEAYKQQDLARLYDYVVKSPDSSSEFNENYIYKRNQKWISLIEEKIKNQSCFIAVGAAHLPGDKGILNLLRNQGYTITPVK